MRLTIKTRFILFGTLFVILPMICMAFFFIGLFRESILDRYQNEQSRILDSIVQNSIDERIELVEKILLRYSQDPRLQSGQRSPQGLVSIQKEWETLLTVLGWNSWIYSVLDKGEVISVPDIQGTGLQGQQETAAGITWSKAHWSPLLQEVVIAATIPINDHSGAKNGFLSLASSLKSYFTSFKHEAFKENARILALFPDSRVISFHRKPGEPVEYDDLYPWKELMNAPNKRQLISLQGENYYAFTIFIQRLNIQLISLFPSKNIQHEILPILEFIALIIALAALISLLGLHIMTKHINRTISGINSYMGKVSRGHLDIRHQVKGNDELTVLNNYLNAMVASLADTIQEKEKLLELRTTLLHIISHNASTPITILFNNSMELLEEEDDKKQELTELFLATKNLKSLLENTMLYLKMEEGLGAEQMQILDLSEQTRISCRMYEPIAREKRLSFTVHFQEEVYIRANYYLLRTILENLIDNAVKYSLPGGRIHITGQREGKRIRWEIIDSGPGFSDEDRENLYKKFTRLSARPSKGEPSSGLGLYLTRKLQERLGGEIRLEEQRKEEGAHFTLFFHAAHIETENKIAVPQESGSGRPPA